MKNKKGLLFGCRKTRDYDISYHICTHTCTGDKDERKKKVLLSHIIDPYKGEIDDMKKEREMWLLLTEK